MDDALARDLAPRLPPPSAAQRRLWFVSQFEDQGRTYNVPVALHLRGRLDVAALERALALMTQRHDALRFRFPAVDGEPVIDEVEEPFALARATASDDAAFDSFAAAEAARPFNLEHGPLFRATLVARGPEAHALLLNCHHIIIDDWSVAVLLRDLGRAYDALVAGLTPPLPPTQFRFADHLAREATEGIPFLEEQYDHWARRLADAPALIPLPTDNPRPRVQSFVGDRVSFTVPAPAAAALRGLGRQLGATLFMTGLAAFALVLARYTRQADLVVGAPMARRTTPEAEGLVGFFVNVVPLRLDLGGAPTFAEMVRRVRAELLDALDNADVPFDGLVERLRPRRDPGHTPLFQVMFDALADSFGTLTMSGLEVEASPLNSGTSKYDLTLSLKDTGSHILGAVEYSTDLFTAATAERLARHYTILLAAAVAAPETPIAQLPLMPADEVATLLALAQPASPLAPPPWPAFPRLFQAAAARRATAVAIVHGDRQIRYGELAARVDALAARLTAAGAVPGRPVAVMLDYGPDVVVALLAIHRAGAAFLPVSPEDARAPEVLADAAPTLILTTAARQPSNPPAPLLLIEAGAEGGAIPPPVNWAPVSWAAEDLAYVLYTSGSTGRPKGVRVTHGALAAACQAWAQVYDLADPDLATLQMANFTFDVFIGDVARTLGSGGRLVMVPRDTLLDPPSLYRLMLAETVRFAEFVPVVLRELLTHLEAVGQRLDGLKTLVCGSDIWFVHEYRRVQALCAAGARVYGSYGVTEATIDSALIALEAPQGLDGGERAMPIGRPIPSAQLHVLDPDLCLVPVGVPGELVIGGPAVADGYLNRPDLTASRFLTGGFDTHGRLVAGLGPGRYYRTGDLCRQSPDGVIEFLGRLDNQVKIRGFRIEPGEVETVLSEHPGVRECAVLAHPAPGGEAELAAYVRGEAPLDAVRAYLRQRLPAHMVPSHLMAMDVFPLTSSGKINRKALPSPAPVIGNGVQVAPRDETERQVAALWVELLRVPAVGAHDDFFALGGHSLLGARLMSRLRDHFGVALPLSDLFAGPTVADLAERVAAAKRESGPAAPGDDAPLPPAPADERRRLSHAQRRLWLTQRLGGMTAAYNIPDAQRLRGPLDTGALALALADVAARHEALRSRFSATVDSITTADGHRVEEPTVAIMPPGPVDLVQRPATEDTLPGLLAEQASLVFDLAREAPLRALLLTLAADDHVLCVTTHHIASDGWSSGLFWRELAACYDARRNHRTPSLPPLPAQYADYATWQRGRLVETEHAHLAYWRRQLANPPTPLALPVRPGAPTPASDVGATLDFTLPPALAQDLRQRAQAWRCTPFMVLYAAFTLVLWRYTGQDDIMVGCPVAGRRHRDAEPLIGFFVNMLPLRLTIGGDDTVASLAARARQTCLEAFDHQDVPFDLLVERLNPERGPGQHPYFQVGLVWQDGVEAPTTLGDLAMTPVPVALNHAKLDLVLALGGPEARTASLAYRTDLFDDATIARLRDHLLVLLAGLAEGDDARRVADLPLLTAAERRQALVDWNDTATPWPHPAPTLDGVISTQAQRTPDAVALEHGGRRWSYRALDRLAGHLAMTLRARGVGRGDTVGLYTGRHPHLVTGMLGILKAGAAYVPLDPEAPADGWSRHVVADAGLSAVVTRADMASAAAALGLPLVVVDDLVDDAPVDPDTGLSGERQPGDRAYILYTSGSTGRPKGVAVSHGAIRNTVLAFIRHMALAPGARLLQFFSPVFDGVGCEVFPTLAGGGTVVFADRADLLPGPPLARTLARNRISHLLITPSALRLVPEDDLPDLQVIMVAGEACPPALAQRWATGRRFLNGYGPTETAVCASVTDYWAERGRLVLRPLENATLDVLDAAGNLMPVGLAGELCVGGAGLADGYLNLPDRTAAAFVSDRNRAGGRLYRTGDRVRRRPDGSIEFLGRADRQVKVRGFRIELDEVAVALARLPGVREAAALAPADREGQRQLVAYVVADGTSQWLRAAARRALPPSLVPDRIILLDALPKTSAGKIDHGALPAPSDQPALPSPAGAPVGALVGDGTLAIVTAIWREVLDRADVGPDEAFFDAGGHSLRLAVLHQRLTARFGPRLALADLLQHPTIRAQARALQGAPEGTIMPAPAAPAMTDDTAIAVIGLAGRFPGAGDVAAFWRNLREGIDVTTHFTEAELRARGAEAETLAHPGLVRTALPLEDMDRFDSGFFGFSPKEAQVMDPQQRLFLECAWTALEDGGYGDTAGPDRQIGVFAACGISHYLLDNVHPRRRELRLRPEQWVLGNDKDFLATRVAYKLDLRGPALTVETACSSSLVAVHMACESLRRGECAMALAGGVSIDAERVGYVSADGGILSAGGRCRPFDAAADGTTSGSGLAVVLLKPLAAAQADGDTIHAVIRGSAVNNDGTDKVSYTAPSVAGQARVIRQALAAAGVDAGTIGYVEAHGTGTRLGDPVEVRALAQALGDAAGTRAHPCVLGAVKGNIGHLDTAAGVAGLVKTVLALEQGIIPPTLGYDRPNPEIDFAAGPFTVAASALSWPAGAQRRAGVSSFGVGGTNAHVVLDAAPDTPAPVPDAQAGGRAIILPLSARTPQALAILARRLADHLRRHPEQVADAAYTLQVGRARLSHRATVVAHSAAEAAAGLAGAVASATVEKRVGRPVVFLFPGQGSQHVDMARELHAADPVFRATFDRCADILASPLAMDLRDLVHPPAEGDRAAAVERLTQTRYAQPALFAIEYALAQSLMAAGVRPSALMGHSLGEYVAACLSGLFTLDEALALVARRGALMQAQPPGAMLAVEGPAQAIISYLALGVEIAAENSPNHRVLAGSHDAISAVEAACVADGRPHRRLQTSHAFHSALMAGAADGLLLASHPPAGRLTIPFVSNLTGTWFNATDAADPTYWARHLRQPVRFADGLATLTAEGDPILVEVGPGRALTTLLADRDVIPCLPHARETAGDADTYAQALALLWRRGADLDWRARHLDAAGRIARRRVPLPTYPFQRDRHWIDRPGAPQPPLVRYWRRDGADRIIVTLGLSADHWMVDGHRLFDGRPTLPGTGCLELARAAVAAVSGEALPTLSEVYFPAPLVLDPEEAPQVRLVLTGTGPVRDFVLESRAAGNEDWRPHAQGLAEPAAGPPPPSAVPEPRGEAVPLAPLAQALVAYGPAWRCFEQVWRDGTDAGWAWLCQPDQDMDADLALHPALADMATAFLSLATRLDQGDTRALVPFHYGRVQLYQPLPRRLLSHARRVGPDAYDVDLYAPRTEGTDGLSRVATIERFTLRAAMSAPAAARTPADWCQVPVTRPAPAIGPALTAVRWLVFGDLPVAAPPGSVMVEAGPHFERVADDRYRLRPNHAADHAALLDALRAEGGVPGQMIHAWTLTGGTVAAGTVADGTVADGFASLLALARAFGPAVHTPTILTLLTRQAAGLPGEAAAPAAAGAVGLSRALGWEFPALRCRQIDLDAGTDPAALARELAATPPDPAPPGGTTVALRQGRRLILDLEPLAPRVDGDGPTWRAGGVYLITGGLGGMGLALAHHIARSAPGAKLALIARSQRDEPALASLGILGAEVAVFAADMGDAAAVRAAVAAVRHRFGAVAGVIHAAGREASGLVETTTEAAWRTVLAPKVAGTDALIDAVSGDGPDFILLCGSLAAWVGGLGQGDYAAANTYLEAAARRARAAGYPVTAVAWDTWAEVGMAVNHARRQGRGNAALDGLSTTEGCQVFDRAIMCGQPVLVVAKDRSLAALADPAGSRAGTPTAGRTGAGGPPRTATEQALADLWEDLLGVKRPGVEDNFFDLGGHSLLGTQLIARLRERWGRCLTLAEFLEEPTIARIARSLPVDDASGAGGVAIGAGSALDPDVQYCLVPVQARGTGRPFFCLPGMGGNVSQLLPLASALGDDRPFYGLQCLGLDGQREPHQSVEAMADHYIRCVRAVQPEGPYLLGGHSLGGKVAFEMAWRLTQAGERVAHLALFDSAAPPYARLPQPDDSQVLYTVLSIFGHYVGRRVAPDAAERRHVAALDLKGKLAFLQRRMEEFGLVKPGSDPGPIRGLFAVYQAAGRFGGHYDPNHAPITVPMTLYQARDPLPPGVSLPEIRLTPAWGWERFSTLPVALHAVPGDHFTCLTAAHVQALADTLRRELAVAEGMATGKAGAT
ncbi:non-ribosomal peptide synthetase/type I polyketide synthase [Nitrospirillum pindoramense]|uniref:Amino acid adenylation domain-containing protein n=1 Tax=Nitrospirillum amazonense TaxID=28077 RepID=A0A560GTB4_9PROT|nr:non-ribosomal peptide synthetase/type I polyketide synthase [Nitrospirillum amazonense]TWB37256.1 amino acid adenylation domain-containing protein [Nitrospirillum amazonense]